MKMRLLPFVLLVASTAAAWAGTPEDDLLQAVRTGDVAGAKALLDKGVAVDTKYRYDRTPLSFAADRGNVEMVKLLLDRGANPDAEDTFYHNTPLGSAAYKGNAEVVKVLLPHTKGVVNALLPGVYGNKPEVVAAVLATGKISPRDLSYTLEAAEKNGGTEIAEMLRKAGATPPPKADSAVDPAVLGRYAGRYRQEDGTEEFTLAVVDGGLHVNFGSRPFKLGAIDAQHFQQLEAPGVTLEMRVEGDRVAGATVTEIGSETRYRRVEEGKP